jgi:hypothetical protein
MKTDDLIAQLTAEEARPMRLAHWPGVFGGAVLVTAAMFLAILGLRPGLAGSLTEPRFLAKIGVMVLLVCICIAGLPRLVRPTESARLRPVLVLPPALLALAVVVELITSPAETWEARAIGSNALLCMVCIPVLSLGGLALFIAALRQGAPSRPILSGALAGLAAGALGASFYGLHCPDDSPLFVAIWYTIALAGVTALGAWCGHKWLRW